MTLQDCESNSDGPTERIIGTYPILFDMLAHEHLIILHRSEHLNHNRSIISSDYANSANIIDSDFTSKSGSLDHFIPGRETIVDFTSIATRIVHLKISGVEKKLVEYATSDDNIAYSTFSSLGIIDGSATLIIPSTSLRYLKVRISGIVIFTTASRITLAANGYILHVLSNNILVFDPTNNRVKKVIGKSDFTSGSGNGEFNFPDGMEFDSSGNLYVVDRSNHRVQKFDSSYDYVSQFGSFGTGDGQFSSPKDITIDSSGNIFVVDSSNHRIQKFNSSFVFQAKIGSFGTGGSQFQVPKSIVVDSLDNVYVLDGNNTRIQKFTNALAFSIQVATNINADIAINSLDKIFILRPSSNLIEEFNTSLVSQGTTPTDGTSPVFMAIDSSDNVYVSDSTKDKIEKYNSSLVFQSDLGAGTGIYSDTTSIIDEIFVPSEGSGKVSSVILQMEDPSHASIWINLPNIPIIPLAAKATSPNPTNDNLSPVAIKSQLVPNCPVGKIRALVTIIDGKSKDTFTFVKYGKQA